ncbi:uncharacterized protein LOC130786920 isoform X2 [Actinidia eriantha]|uniref:uncharacterized protein LOC130786920 isoform X2 n=1 Tax=Actinidia eriantha TaxID=165200 RepID=UPI00258546C6|nr:uncharacterized protein LOC130786920 isoform X2 [Actinidia eriantha]
MGKKRKSVETSLDEVDRTMYSTFCSAANSLSQLYTQTMNQQKLSFQAGERHGLEKLYQWIWRQQEGGSRVNTADVLTYLQPYLGNFLVSSQSSHTFLRNLVSKDALGSGWLAGMEL